MFLRKEIIGKLEKLKKLLEDENRQAVLLFTMEKRVTALEKQNEKLRSGEKIIRETVGQILETMPPVKCPPKPKLSKAKRSSETAVAHISDVHIGKVTPSYNIDVARDRIGSNHHRATSFARRCRPATTDRRKNAGIVTRQATCPCAGNASVGRSDWPGLQQAVPQRENHG